MVPTPASRSEVAGADEEFTRFNRHWSPRPSPRVNELRSLIALKSPPAVGLNAQGAPFSSPRPTGYMTRTPFASRTRLANPCLP